MASLTPPDPISIIDKVRALRLAEPSLGVKPLVAKLREQQPDMLVGAKEVRLALVALKAGCERADLTDAQAPKALEAGSEKRPAAEVTDARHMRWGMCWGCKVVAAKQQCGRCKDRQLNGGYYCSAGCFKDHWREHKAWHKEQESNTLAMEEGRTRRTDYTDADLAKFSESKYEIVVQLGAGSRHLKEYEFRKAAKVFRKILQQRPDTLAAHKGLAHALGRSNDSVGACESFLRIVDMLQPKLANQPSADDITMWAESWLSAFDLLIRPGACSAMPKPDWWNDASLLIGSAMLVDSLPDFCGAWNIRAMVLAGGHAGAGSWGFGPVSRSAAQLREAAECVQREASFHREIELSGGTMFAPAERARCERLESEHRRRADEIEAACLRGGHSHALIGRGA